MLKLMVLRTGDDSLATAVDVAAIRHRRPKVPGVYMLVRVYTR